MKQWQLIALVALLYLKLCSALEPTAQIPRLFPNEPLTESIDLSLSKPSQLFYRILLKDLKPDSSYEVRLSYLATSPTSFDIKFVTKDFAPKSSKGRSLLNIEKLMFETDNNGLIPGKDVLEFEQGSGPSYVLCLTALNAGVSVVPSTQTREVEFIIVLEKLFYGLPYDTMIIAVITSVAVIFVVTVAIPQLLPFLVAFNRKHGHSN